MQRLRLRTFVDVRPGEVGALLLSFAYFFFLLCGYYILRPLRDAWGIEGGTDKLQWLFIATFLTMLVVNPLYSAVVTRGSRRRIVPHVYRFFALNLVGFYVLLQLDVDRIHVGYAYFVWVSVFNVFVVAIFWSFMADLFSNEQGRRMFSFIAMGGTLGALTGPLITKFLALELGTANLLLLSAVLLEVCTQCVGWLLRHCDAQPAMQAGDAATSAGDAARSGGDAAAGAGAQRAANRATNRATNRAGGADDRVGGSILGGIRLVFEDPYMLGVAAQILCLTTTATFLYLLQARLVAETVEGTAARTAAFANIDLVVNSLEIGLQLCVTAPLIRRAGLANALRVLPFVTGVGSLVLAAQPTVLVLTVFQGIRRAVQYAVYRPARELLFTVVGRERKYATKGFIDTAVYRGGDMVSAQAFAGLEFLGLKTAGLALAGLPIVGGWWMLSGFLARRQQELALAQSAAVNPPLACAPDAASALDTSLHPPTPPAKGPAA